ncbi:MAG: hypothetical protein EBZ69_06285, partial [Alphaproteobacteria bacterium]|nr:hypothetical protein [Alphaproteobacteria bacterium]
AFMAFVHDDASASVVRAFAVAQGWPAATVQQADPQLFAKMLEEASPPQLAVIDLDMFNDPLNDMARLIDICGSATRFIGIGMSNDVRLYRELIRLGVADYLPKPISEEALSQARISASKTPLVLGEKPREEKTARMVVVVGTQGGVGGTSTAVNIAWILSQTRAANVGLIDMDPHFGGCALALDIEASRGLRELLANPGRVDALMLASAMMMAAPRLAVLSCEESLDDALHLDPAALQQIMAQLIQLQDWLVLDVPRSQVMQQKPVLAKADDVLIVAEASLQGVRDTLRLKKWFSDHAPQAKIYVLLSRMGKERQTQMDEAAFNKGIEGKIALTLPEDKAMIDASKHGKPVAALKADAPLAVAYGKLVDMLSPPTRAAETKGGWLAGLLKGPPKKQS